MRARREVNQIIFMSVVFLTLVAFKAFTDGSLTHDTQSPEPASAALLVSPN